MIWFLASAVLSYISVPVLLPVYAGQVRQNYLGEQVPTGLGTAFILPSVLVLIILSGGENKGLWLALLLLLFSIFGLLDDTLGGAEQKGFRGHFSQRTLSTGALKAWGGGIASVVVSAQFGTGVLDVLISAALIALAANFLNLLDLRPGRAGKAFFVLGFPLLLFGGQTLQSVSVVLLAVLGYLPWDLKRKAMMGDTGANPLGATLGYFAALHFPVFAKVVLLTVLASLNIVAEKVSFSRIIESNRFLQFLDRLGR
ncbi:MAG: UDP-N-acetylmuramyl pentapeptide phosphotransferase [Firmicutes bacterium]|nr:UDP-N-acetylmuramyl pentapeptide phosphotransferase [Bacillota bacterium]